MAELPEHAVKTIQDFQEKLAELEREGNKFKTSINMLCSMYGVEPLYSLEDAATGDGSGTAKSVTLSFRPDEFFGKPLATCVRDILTARKDRDLGPADPRDIFETLKKGGFNFEARDDESAFRGMQISIGKNTAAFVRLPNEQIGLVEWYRRAATRRVRRQLHTAETFNEVTGGVSAQEHFDRDRAEMADRMLLISAQPGNRLEEEEEEEKDDDL